MSTSRAFGVSSLATLPRDTIRQLCFTLLADRGIRVVQQLRFGEHDDFVIEVVGGLRLQRARVRVLYRSARQQDIADLEALIRGDDLADATLVEAARPGQVQTKRVHLIRGRDLIALLQVSPSIQWPDGLPEPDRELLALFFNRSNLLQRLDTLGIRSIPALSRNRVPTPLHGVGISADRLLEEFTFRLLTACFRFSGRRLGNTVPGTIAPDAVLMLPAQPDGLLLDCKASRDGFVMTIADERALRDYANISRAELKATGHVLRWIVIVSSSFPGSDNRKHPYYRRARALEASAGVRLVYLSADGISELGLRLEEEQPSTERRASLNWNGLFEAGLTKRNDVLALLDG